MLVLKEQIQFAYDLIRNDKITKNKTIMGEDRCLKENVAFIRYNMGNNTLIINPFEGKVPDLRNVINTEKQTIINWIDNDYQPITIKKINS